MAMMATVAAFAAAQSFHTELTTVAKLCLAFADDSAKQEVGHDGEPLAGEGEGDADELRLITQHIQKIAEREERRRLRRVDGREGADRFKAMQQEAKRFRSKLSSFMEKVDEVMEQMMVLSTSFEKLLGVSLCDELDAVHVELPLVQQDTLHCTDLFDKSWLYLDGIVELMLAPPVAPQDIASRSAGGIFT